MRESVRRLHMTRCGAQIVLTASLAALAAFAGRASAQSPRHPDIARVRDSVIILTDGTRWQPGLWGIRYLATITAPGSRPYFVLAAYSCDECDAGPDLWVLRAGDTDSTAFAFMYPGTHIEIGVDAPYGTARAFVGHCLPDHDEVLVSLWHANTTPPSPDTLDVFVPDSLHSRIIRVPSEPQTLPPILHAVAHGWCHELPRARRTP
jgi:hypothetical protein